jgi:hypothetical protein
MSVAKVLVEAQVGGTEFFEYMNWILSQPEKASSPMLVTELPMVMLVRRLQP